MAIRRKGISEALPLPNGHTYITNHYDQKGRVVRQELAGKMEEAGEDGIRSY